MRVDDIHSAHEAGSVDAFRQSWRALDASERYHFSRRDPQTQVQFAFQNHWRVFRSLMEPIRGGRALEVGCGRGSMAAFFSDAGFETHLLDTSTTALEIARKNFSLDGLKGLPVAGNALALPYSDEVFDATVSIGLLEHFAEIEQPLAEQLRVLRSGGVFLGYVVPERVLSVQCLAWPINAFLRLRQTVRGRKGVMGGKSPLFRNGLRSDDFIAVLKRRGVSRAGAFGMFPVPLISHSPSFPFSANDPHVERTIIRVWERLLRRRRRAADPWICPELWGLAFLVWAYK